MVDDSAQLSNMGDLWTLEIRHFEMERAMQHQSAEAPSESDERFTQSMANAGPCIARARDFGLMQ